MAKNEKGLNGSAKLDLTNDDTGAKFIDAYLGAVKRGISLQAFATETGIEAKKVASRWNSFQAGLRKKNNDKKLTLVKLKSEGSRGRESKIDYAKLLSEAVAKK